MTFNSKKISLFLILTVNVMEISGVSYTTSYLGCYGDAADRAMGSLQRINASSVHGFSILEGETFAYMPSTPTPIETCALVCSTFRLPYFGLQAAFACFCSAEGYDSLGLKPESDCNHNCQGNPSEKCGGDFANSVYKINYSFDKGRAFFAPDTYAKSLGWLGVEGSELKIVNVFKKFVCAVECFKQGSGCASFKFNATHGFCYVNKYLAASNTLDVFALPL